MRLRVGLTLGELWRLFQWHLIHLAPQRDVTVDTFNGRLTFDNKQWLIGKYLYVRRSHEEYEIQSAIKLLYEEGYLNDTSAEGTVINVGANIGMTCIGLLRSRHFARAIAFEPAPDNYRLLVKNIEQNGFSGCIRSFQLALSSVDAELDFELSRDNAGDHRIRQVETPGFYEEEKRHTIKVLSQKLDSFWSQNSHLHNGYGGVNLLWVDIQGHEGHFFQGARNLLSQGIPVITEFWPYGIERSGILPRQFCEILAEQFSHFYVVGDANYRKVPIRDIEQLFKVYSGPRAFGLIALVSDSSRP